MISGKRIREPIPAKRKKQALAKAKYKCQFKGCNEKEILDFHHINMKNDDNRLSNIAVLCPTHHRKIHKKIKVKVEKEILGREIKRRIIKVKPKSKTKKKAVKKKTTRTKSKNPYTLNIPSFKY